MGYIVGKHGVREIKEPISRATTQTEQWRPLDYWKAVQELVDAALNMVDVKGRHHSEMAMNRLIEAAKAFRAQNGGPSA